jgi:hypothetical protein
MDVAVRAGLPIESVIGDIDLSRLADPVRGSRLVVCGDTGIAHLATAYRTPSVVLFGPQSPARWGPPASPLHRILWRPEADGNHSSHGRRAMVQPSAASRRRWPTGCSPIPASKGAWRILDRAYWFAGRPASGTERALSASTAPHVSGWSAELRG